MLLLAILGLGMPGAAAYSHELGIARVTLDLGEPGTLALHASIASAISDAPPVVPGRCRRTETVLRPGPFEDIRASWAFDCGPSNFTSGDVVIFDWPLEGIFVTREDGDFDGRFVDRDEQGIVLSLAEFSATSTRADVSFPQYFSFGVEHILSGWDHLAFVLVLCLLAQGWRLVSLVTAFTVGHSITLALASLGFANVASPPIEALIALSIAFMAREALRSRNQAQGYLIVIGFGLLHGLGFAGALTEFGLQQDNLLVALLAFNLGVETGQLLFVLGTVLSLVLLRNIMTPMKLQTSVAYSIGVLAIFWTVERVIAFST